MGTTKMDNQTIKAPLYIHQADMKKVIYNQWDNVLFNLVAENSEGLKKVMCEQVDNVLPLIIEDSKAYFKLICEGRLVLNRHEEVMREIDALGQ